MVPINSALTRRFLLPPSFCPIFLSAGGEKRRRRSNIIITSLFAGLHTRVLVCGGRQDFLLLLLPDSEMVLRGAKNAMWRRLCLAGERKKGVITMMAFFFGSRSVGSHFWSLPPPFLPPKSLSGDLFLVAGSYSACVSYRVYIWHFALANPARRPSWD